MATGDAAFIAGKLKNDNRTVVASKTKGASTAVVATSFGTVSPAVVLKTDAASPATLTAETATEAAYVGGVDPADTKAMTIVVGIQPNPTGNAFDKRNLRTQYFHGFYSYDSTKVALGAKRCFVNRLGQPLDAAGVPAATVAAAADAETATYTLAQANAGHAVSNYEQVYRTDPATRSVAPGKYMAHMSQTSLYAPYAGWTCQQG